MGLSAAGRMSVGPKTVARFCTLICVSVRNGCEEREQQRARMCGSKQQKSTVRDRQTEKTDRQTEKTDRQIEKTDGQTDREDRQRGLTDR